MLTSGVTNDSNSQSPSNHGAHKLNTGLISCYYPISCLRFYCCPCLVAGEVSVMLGDEYVVGCCGMIITTPSHAAGCQRYQVLQRIGKSNGACYDFCIGFCCPCCSIAQTRLELELYAPAPLRVPPQLMMKTTQDEMSENTPLNTDNGDAHLDERQITSEV